MGINLCTYFDKNYADKGMALYQSLGRHQKDFRLYVLALDDFTYNSCKSMQNVEVFSLDYLINFFDEFDLAGLIEKRTTREFYWTLTPFWTYFCMMRCGTVAYIDADCFVFDNLRPLYHEVSGKPVAIIPHRFAPQHSGHEAAGKYNVGWVYFDSCETSVRCLEEWCTQCFEWCGEVASGGKYADQKYWDALAEKYNVYSVKHLGANLAPWNQLQYNYSIEYGQFLVNKDPLLFYHFHQHQSPTDRSKWELHPLVIENVYKPYESTLCRLP